VNRAATPPGREPLQTLPRSPQVRSRTGAAARPGLVALAFAAVVLLAACTSGSATPTATKGSQTATPTASATTSGGDVKVSEGPKPPATGAWVGAWVQPDKQTPTRVAAVAAFEHAIGRPLDLVNVYHPWADAFPNASDVEFTQNGKILMISWANTDVASIVSGGADRQITARASALKQLGVPVLLRWRWEMNRKNLASEVGSPAQYIAAWKHIRTIFTAVGATNVGWVWCPIATDFTATNGPAYYPGDDQVDWLCTDVYPGPDHGSFASVASEFMTWAAQHHKPVIIGEYGVEASNPAQAQWIAGAQTYALQNPQIKAMVYFDANRVENGVTRDFRLQGTTGPLQAFQQMVLSPYFNQPRS
jgi:hypothetical protein